MSSKYQNRIEIRGLDDSEIDYLKTLANQQKAKSFNQFLLDLCREKIRHGNFNRAEHLYLVPLKQMAESDRFLVQQTAQQNKDLEQLTAQMENFSHHIARWLKYEGMEDIYE
ncbi:UNVERIFIED_CONTAM: hypothetical protein KB574_01960 [Streptococcus canis]|uniref:Uncharacterized protein n=2 Tax=Streptococcus canis TaxID=1329 RepID=A0A3P5Y7T7_STRCB|nr:hypothetical protein [Streptococcus canis]EIQ82764.1 hypothetical protein SCAZ3_10395 [Streptococcus canis FSL Z3-227]MDV5993887.1 hypothetical protein [Streptococcus canis]QKG78331.1 hypothetical protein GE021_009600 [Streptococcus canis]VDC43765.1 hypothetical protein FMV2238Y02_22680 [Streptococcus canis]GFK30376.1 hypothetical protein ScFU149_04930 [Streptococcus canis]